jgi:hypothetical protein
MRINSKVVFDFISMQTHLASIMKSFNINVTSLCEAIEMPRATFYQKKKEKTFTGHEMKKIVDFINK